MSQKALMEQKIRMVFEELNGYKIKEGLFGELNSAMNEALNDCEAKLHGAYKSGNEKDFDIALSMWRSTMGMIVKFGSSAMPADSASRSSHTRMTAKVTGIKEFDSSVHEGGFSYLYMKSLDDGKSYRVCTSPKFRNFGRWKAIIDEFNSGKEVVLGGLSRLRNSENQIDADSMIIVLKDKQFDFEN